MSAEHFDAPDKDLAADSTSSLSSQVDYGPPYLPARKVAPMFRNVTITPSYDTEQHLSFQPLPEQSLSAFIPYDGCASSSYANPHLEQCISGTTEDYSDHIYRMTGGPDFSAVRMVPPMFRNVTITPCYNIERVTQPIVPVATGLLQVPGSETIACEDGISEAMAAAQAQDTSFY